VAAIGYRSFSLGGIRAGELGRITRPSSAQIDSPGETLRRYIQLLTENNAELPALACYCTPPPPPNPNAKELTQRDVCLRKSQSRELVTRTRSTRASDGRELKSTLGHLGRTRSEQQRGAR